MKNYFFALLLIVFSFLSCKSLLSADKIDVIYLKDSTLVKGDIIEIFPNDSIKIKTIDGKLVVYNYDLIHKIIKEKRPVKSYYNNSYNEFGASIGNPAVFNLALGRWFGPFGLRMSGMYIGLAYGTQLNISLKLSDSKKFMHCLGITGGLMRLNMPDNESVTYKWKSGLNKYNYVGLVYNLYAGGFFLEGGFAIGEGDFTPFQLMFQIGYMRRFVD